MKTHICFGISPFNSKFTQDYICKLIHYGKTEFEGFHLFIPDKPTAFTLRALGYTEQKIKKKMSKQLNWLNNKVKKAFEDNDFDYEQHRHLILNWDKLNKNLAYQEIYRETLETFHQDPDFKRECLQATNWVLEGKLPSCDITQERLEIAVDYLLAEIPLFIASKAIVKAEKSWFYYHQSVDILKKLFERKLPIKPIEGQFLLTSDLGKAFSRKFDIEFLANKIAPIPSRYLQS